MGRMPAQPRQISLFDLDSPLHGKVRGERSIMDFPFFVLSKNAHLEPIEYRHDGVTIEIRPSATGVATMWDKEILLYVASLVSQAIADGQDVDSNVMTFTAHDFFRITGVERPSKRDYRRFADALERLQGTQIKTNIETGSKIDRGWFSWLSEAQVEYEKMANGDEMLRYVRVQICNWMYRAIKRDRRIYHYHHDYFKLGPIERRVYELAHCNCGTGEFEITMDDLYRQVGSMGPIKRFKQLIKAIEQERPLPEYEIAVSEEVRAEKLDSMGRKRKALTSIVTMRPKQRTLSATPRVAV